MWRPAQSGKPQAMETYAEEVRRVLESLAIVAVPPPHPDSVDLAVDVLASLDMAVHSMGARWEKPELRIAEPMSLEDHVVLEPSVVVEWTDGVNRLVLAFTRPILPKVEPSIILTTSNERSTDTKTIERNSFPYESIWQSWIER